MDIKISPSTSDHACYVAANIRKADEKELWDSMLMKPKEALQKSLETSDFISTGYINNEIVGIFGLVRVSLISNKGRPWMISTTALDNKKYWKDFQKIGKVVIVAMLQLFPYLENYVEASNDRSVKWLKVLGFQFDEPQRMGPLAKPFMRFWMQR